MLSAREEDEMELDRSDVRLDDSDDVSAIDRAYKSFPSFEAFVAKVGSMSLARWERALARLDTLRAQHGNVVAYAQNVALRAAAIDTGAIEGLYDTDRGFTFSVAQGFTALDALQAQRGEKVRSYIETQIKAYDSLLDVATGAQPLTSVWVRQLHAIICAGQSTYEVQTAAGPQEHTLELGSYKTHANHVRTRSGKIHAYAPVLDVAPEMDRLLAIINSNTFANAFAALQAAYIHYAFILIHPFADGNGRVARALASIFTYKAARVPVLILAAHRAQYFAALEAADSGDYERFASFIYARAVDAVELVSDELETAALPKAADEVARIGTLYTSGRGWSHAEIDAGGTKLANRLLIHLQKIATELKKPHLSIQFQLSQVPVKGELPGYRGIKPPNTTAVSINASSVEPANASTGVAWRVLVPRADSQLDEYALRQMNGADVAYFPLDDVVSGDDTTTELRLEMLAKRIIGTVVSQLREQAENLLRSKGY
jgi:Fic family protein